MRKKLFLAVSLGFLCVSALQAMEIDETRQGNVQKASTIRNRTQRDHYLNLRDDRHARPYAVAVINETPVADDNEDANIDDFRIARDICGRLHDYFSDATAYSEGVTEFEEATLEDYRIARDLYLKTGDYKNAAYFNGMLPENITTETKK